VEIPNNKYQITNKYQHAAQAPALRVTKILNSKPSILEEWQKNSKKYFNPYWNNRTIKSAIKLQTAPFPLVIPAKAGIQEIQ